MVISTSSVAALVEERRRIEEQIHAMVRPILDILQERFVVVYLKEVVAENDDTVCIWVTTKGDPDGLYSCYGVSVPVEAIDQKDMKRIRAAVETFWDRISTVPDDGPRTFA